MTTIKDGNGIVVLTSTNEDQQISTLLSNHLHASATLDFPSIPANSTNDLTITVAGAVLGNGALATPNGAPEAGLTWKAFVSAANTVTVRLANITTGAINPAVRSWRADVWL